MNAPGFILLLFAMVVAGLGVGAFLAHQENRREIKEYRLQKEQETKARRSKLDSIVLQMKTNRPKAVKEFEIPVFQNWAFFYDSMCVKFTYRPFIPFKQKEEIQLLDVLNLKSEYIYDQYDLDADNEIANLILSQYSTTFK